MQNTYGDKSAGSIKEFVFIYLMYDFYVNLLLHTKIQKNVAIQTFKKLLFTFTVTKVISLSKISYSICEAFFRNP